MQIQTGGDLRRGGKSDVGLLEAAVEIFQPRAPMRREGIFDAGAGGPAEPDIQFFFFRTDRGRVDEALAGPCEAAGGIGQPVTPGITETAAQASRIIQLLDEFGPRRRQQSGDRIRREIIREADIGLDAEHDARRQLHVVAGLHAADHAAERTMGRGDGGIGEHRVGRAAAKAGMRAEVKTGPVKHRLNERRFDRHANGNVGRDSAAIKREQAQAHARQYILPGSAAAVHRVCISSANIPAVSFAITADLPVRCHHRNRIKPWTPPRLQWIGRCSGKSQIKQRRNPFPIFIASNSQLQEGSDPMRLNGTVA